MTISQPVPADGRGADRSAVAPSLPSFTAAPPSGRPRLGVDTILGSSEAIRRLRADLRSIAASEASTVLLLGESGVGKDLVARVIHAESGRSERPFLAVNCSAVPETLLEAEFFGHEAGAFTDARQRKPGLLEVADGGTVFLDEIADVGPGLQAKFLRFLEDRTFRRLGGTKEIEVDVRFVAATNVDLARATREGRFRRDLYYRLSGVSLAIPPLRERPDDIPVLARHFLAEYVRRFHKRFEGFGPGALERLLAHGWPGNVRELANAIERVVLLENGTRVPASSLVLDPLGASPAAPAPALPDATAGESTDEDLAVDGVELRTLVRALERAGGNQTQAARLMKVSRDTVRHWMKRYGIRTETRVIVERPR